MCALLAFSAGCDDSDSVNTASSDSDGVYLLEATCTVIGSSPVSPVNGDLFMYNCGSYDIIITESTRIVKQRESCSGWDEESYGAIDNGDILIVNYAADDINYKVNPPTIRPVYIESYRPECIGAVPSSSGDFWGCDPCDEDFFN